MNQEDTSNTFQNGKMTVPFEDTTKEFIPSMIDTMKLVLMKPVEFFQGYNLDGQIMRPLIFGGIIGWVGAIIGAIWGFFMNLLHFGSFMGRFGGGFGGYAAAGAFMQLIMTIFLAPFAVVASMFIGAGIFHVCLMLFKGAKKPFNTTFNVCAYSMAAYVGNIIPICGGFISGIYALVLVVIGLRETHPTDTGKAVLAVLSPIILFTLCCFVFVLIAGGIGAFMSQMH